MKNTSRLFPLRRRTPGYSVLASLLLAALHEPATIHAAEAAPTLIYENSFSSPAALGDWVVEGPGTKRWQNGAMILEPTGTPAVVALWEKQGRRNLDANTEYYRATEDAMRESHSPLLDRMRNEKGQFVGGHIVVWNRRCETPADFLLEYSFRPLTPVGLAIVQFSARARAGGDVLGPGLAPRHGVFRSYTHGDIDVYHISYFANNPTGGIRGTCNLRKNHGFFLVATGPDYCSEQLDHTKPAFTPQTYRIAVRKVASQIRFTIDGREVFTFTDRVTNDTFGEDGRVAARAVDTGPVLGGGRFALRLMVGLAAEFSHVRVYRLAAPGIVPRDSGAPRPPR